MNFSKYQATGNDFILVDARDPEVRNPLLHLTPQSIAGYCDRRFGIGADGFILLLAHPEYHFEMKTYNSDGQECSMCGNGARALVRFAQDLGIPGPTYRFLAIDGEHEAILQSESVQVRMKDVGEIQATPFGPAMNTGSPHVIQTVSGLAHYPVVQEGKKIRHSEFFQPSGINVNFIEEINGRIHIRTYERGVEDETLSCGTGVVAVALALATKSGETFIQAKGGLLSVQFEKNNDSFKNIWLKGPAEKTFEGTI